MSIATTLVTLRFLFALAASSLFTSQVLATPIVQVSPATAITTVGQAFQVNLIGEDFIDLYAYNFTLNFDPTRIQVVSVDEGLLLASAGTTFFIPGVIDNVVGSISFIGNTLIGAIPGAIGNGTLAMIGFEAIAEGTSPLSLVDLLFLDSGLSNLVTTPQESMVTVIAGSGNPIPEPATLPLMLMGIGTYAFLRQRKKQR
ncbi:MAG: cohesin domain-containing protein [Candidatus Nitrotoga sp.]